MVSVGEFKRMMASGICGNFAILFVPAVFWLSLGDSFRNLWVNLKFVRSKVCVLVARNHNKGGVQERKNLGQSWLGFQVELVMNIDFV